jgi:hypothetical protein
MKSSVIITRARARGPKESLKLNNFITQTIRDLHKLLAQLEENDSTIASNYSAAFTAVDGAAKNITGLDNSIKSILKSL